MALGESIKKGHDEYRRFFAKLRKTGAADSSLREELFLDFKKKLYAHHEGEEIDVFPILLKVPALKGLTYELMVEHEDMKKHFEALSKEDYGEASWVYKLAPLYDVMHAHWLKEEELIIPFWPDYFSEADWEALGKKFDQTVQQYLKSH